MKCEVISLKNLETSDIIGNYLFSDEKNCYFYSKKGQDKFILFHLLKIKINLMNLTCQQ